MKSNIISTSFLFFVITGIMASCDAGNQPQTKRSEQKTLAEMEEYSEGIKYLEKVGLETLVKTMERLDKLPEDELDLEIETMYRTRNLSHHSYSYQDPRFMDSICRATMKLKMKNVLLSLFRKMNGEKYREEFMRLCLGSGERSFVEELQRKWAKSVDFKKKRHLISLVGHLDDPRKEAKKVIADPSFGIQARCISMDILALNGSLEDLDFLKKYFSHLDSQKGTNMNSKEKTHVAPSRASDASPIVQERKCAKEAANFLVRRLKTQKEKL